ncbi:MAG: hypothetical protein HY617_03500 [Candidatus Sungbacteria bacterium]|nr:hypothetical protein [Candidatus Sungbacteria bacterium]
MCEFCDEGPVDLEGLQWDLHSSRRVTIFRKEGSDLKAITQSQGNVRVRLVLEVMPTSSCDDDCKECRSSFIPLEEVMAVEAVPSLQRVDARPETTLWIRDSTGVLIRTRFQAT